MILFIDIFIIGIGVDVFFIVMNLYEEEVWSFVMNFF